ncbi:hypothetical protein TIFTF001_001949 [Ficus carica]|uniref:non-specific serine/threonine protein kinase n=1 Tax=Ficus carica TaxID=3494 RepID=A0AA88CS86_FICCA|nr:hypothetical protein TIFTF001_001949 [Ficus carica]
MHLHLPRQISFSILIAALILTCSPCSSVFAQEHEQYRNCSARFNCANMPGLGYPFLGPDRKAYCGHPEFQLNCSGEAPVITINSIDYRVLEIDDGGHVLKVVRTDYWNNTCPEVHENSTSLDPTFYDYASDTQDLTLHYRCLTATAIGDALVASQFSCPDDGTTHTNYYTTDRTRNLISGYTLMCDETVVVRISNSEAGVLEGATTLSRANLSAALDAGFRLDWDANNSRCGDCSSSGGVCGINSTTSEFACYCRDRPYASRCGSDSVSGSGTCQFLLFQFVFLRFRAA